MNLYENLRQKNGNFFLMAGPCVIENEQMPFDIAKELSDICQGLGIELVFKASYRKANRSRLDSFTGIGDEKALKLLAEVRERFSVPVVTDIHSKYEAELAADYVDVIQIPAFLCRQTDLLVAAAKTDKIINIKKGQFLSAHAMRFALDKVLSCGNDKVLLTERGNIYGYNNLIVDFRNIADMLEIVPTVIMDCTHSVQRPGAGGGKTSGDRRFVPAMALAAKAFGATGYFFEVHPDPDNALSDGPNMLRLDDLEGVIRSICK